MDIADNLLKIVPSNMDEEWLTSVWEGELMSIPNLPDDYEELCELENCTKLMMHATHSIKDLLRTANQQQQSSDSEDDNEEDVINNLWDSLKESGLCFKKILPILCYFISNGTSNFEDPHARHLALNATSCYFTLLSVPGSITYGMYHSILYTYSLNTLKLAIKISIAPSKKKKKAAKSKLMDIDVGDEEEEGAGDNDKYQVTDQERRLLVPALVAVLQDLLQMLQNVSLKGKVDAIEHSIQQLVELSYLEHTTSIFDFRITTQTNVSSLVLNAFLGLHLICQPIHGEVPYLVTLVMKQILNLLLATQQSSMLELAPRELTIVRDNAVRFIGYLARTIGPQSWKGVMILVQHLVTKATDRVENRQRASQISVLLMRELPPPLRNNLMRWVFFLAHSEKPAHRLMALELVSQLMLEDECEDTQDEPDTQEHTFPPRSRDQVATKRETEGGEGQASGGEGQASGGEGQADGGEGDSEDDGEEDVDETLILSAGTHAFKHKHMLGLILYRCDDVAPTVRAKALSMLVDFTCTRNKQMIEMMQKVFVDPYEVGRRSMESEETGFLRHEDFVRVLDDPQLLVVPGGRSVVRLVTDMTEDERVMVRKAALQALVNIARLNRYWLSPELLELLSQHCRDPAMMVRKQMLTCMTDLLLTYLHNEVPQLPEVWLTSMLTNVQDPEVKVQEMVLELLHNVLLGNLRPHGADSEPLHELPWELLRLIPQHDMQNFLSEALRIWTKEKKLPSSLIGLLQSHVATEHNEQAWLMLSLLAQNKPLTSPSFVYNYWQQHMEHITEGDLPVLYRVLRLLLLSVGHLSEQQRIVVHEQLLGRLRSFSLPIELVGVAMDLVAACDIEENHNKEEALKAVGQWCKQMLKELEAALECCLSKSRGGGGPDEERLLQQICTLGDVVRVGNLTTSSRTLRVLHSILLAGHNVAAAPKVKFRPKRLCIKPSVVVQAVTVAALGKLALQQEATAHELLPSFGYLLNHSKDNALRHNILCALADLCGRYAVLVDPLVPRMASCLRDEDTALRQQALVLMVQLLQEDFVKLRHGLFYFLLRMLCDPEPDLQGIANFYLTENLLKKQPNAMFASFNGALFFFNEYMEHESFSSMRLPVETIKLLAMVGPENREQRLKMYSFMLEHMDDDHRFQTMHRLCMDILGGFVDDKLSLDGAGAALLGDTLAVLSSDEIRLRSMHAKTSDEQDVPDPEEACTNAMVTARKAVVTAVVKRNVMENIVPVIRSLKLKLQGLRSPLAEDLMLYLRDLMRDFKSEIQDILAGDRQLAAEVAFDIRQLEEREEANAPPRTPEEMTAN